MSLPIFNGVDKNLSMLQTAWSSMINPFLGRPTNQTNVIQNVSLISGVTVVNHLLGRVPQGWFITDINGAATIYRSAAFNPLTLTLTSNAAVVASIGVF
jgi:hypothetical protein